MLNISNGPINRAQKVLIYGPEGIGKSSLASRFPDGLFIDTEGGTAQLNVRRIEGIVSFEKLIAAIYEVAETPDVCETLVVDTADWAEQRCIVDLCTKYRKTGIEEFGYGKGYTYLAEEFSRLLAACDRVIAKGIHVVITAHAKTRKFELPEEMGAYDRWELKLTKQVYPLLKEWADIILFCNYKTFVVATENDTKKAQGGKRVMYATHHPCWDAKNRHNLPDEMDLDYAHIAHIFEAPTEREAQPVKKEGDELVPLEQVKKLMDESHVTLDEVQAVVVSKGHFPETVTLEQYPEAFITKWIIPNWTQIVGVIESNPDRLPF